MTRSEVFDAVAAIIKTTFKAAHVDIGDSTTAADVDGWDSLAHATLIVRLEKHFNVRIPEATAYRTDTVGELVDAICTLVEK